MKPDDISDEHRLADRLIGYSDAIVALAFVISSGLGLAITDPDTRSTFADVIQLLVLINVFFGAVFSLLLATLHRWELDLRPETDQTDKYRRYSRRIYLAHHAVVWISVTQTIASMLAIGV